MRMEMLVCAVPAQEVGWVDAADRSAGPMQMLFASLQVDDCVPYPNCRMTKLEVLAAVTTPSSCGQTVHAPVATCLPWAVPLLVAPLVAHPTACAPMHDAVLMFLQSQPLQRVVRLWAGQTPMAQRPSVVQVLVKAWEVVAGLSAGVLPTRFARMQVADSVLWMS
jgi:hypothetical protein